MFSILKKEFNTFFSSPIAYLVIGVFLIVNGLFLWYFNDEFNILNAGFADLNNFFFLAPWLFLFLIPAITMRSFAEEYNTGTIEILKTLPITNWQITLGKFFGALALVLIAILPTLTYVYTISQLANPEGNIDFGSIIGSYVGLIFIAACYTSIGIFTSTLTKNQIVAFIASAFICLVLFYGFEAMSESVVFLDKLSLYNYYKSISRGVIDTRDILFFSSVILFFLFLTKQQLDE